MKVSIIIPTYNHFSDLLRPCLESVEKYTDLSNKEIIVVSNGSIDETVPYVEFKKRSNLPYKLLEFPRPIGFPKANNIGALAAEGEYLVLLNNDAVILGPFWIEILLKPFLEDPKMGITGPCKFKVADLVSKLNFDFWFIVFFCAMIKRSVYEELGGLDEKFSPGRGEDTDFCLTAQKMGYKIRRVPHEEIKLKDNVEHSEFPIYHVFSRTMTDQEEKEMLDKRNAEYIIKKHSKGM
jgi:GT2 family glycosyltransferase